MREIENYDKFYSGKFDGSDSKIVISKKQDFVESLPPAQFIRYLKSFSKAILDINKPLRL